MWIESHQELRDHPKTRRLARALGVGVPAAIGHLHCLWWFALDYAPDGSLAGFAAWEIADAAMWDGDPDAFVAALVDVRYVDGDGRATLHDWHEYGGKVLAARERSRARAARARSGAEPADSGVAPEAYAHGTRTVPEPSGSVPNGSKQITRDERREEEKTVFADETSAQRGRETQFRDSWQLTDDLVAWATAKGWPEPWVRDVTEEFRHYWLSRTVRRKDWNAAWRTWVAREARTRPPRPQAARPVAAPRAVDWTDEAAVFGTGGAA